MSKKDFEAIAAVLNANMASLELVEDMADMLSEQNERFDDARFIRASTAKFSERLDFLTKTLARETK